MKHAALVQTVPPRKFSFAGEVGSSLWLTLQSWRVLPSRGEPMSAPSSHPPKDPAPKQALEAERLAIFAGSELTPFRMNTCGAKDFPLKNRGRGVGERNGNPSQEVWLTPRMCGPGKPYLSERSLLHPTKCFRTKQIDLLERFPSVGDYSSQTKSLRLPIAPLISPPATSTTPLAVSFLHRSASKSQ